MELLLFYFFSSKPITLREIDSKAHCLLTCPIFFQNVLHSNSNSYSIHEHVRQFNLAHLWRLRCCLWLLFWRTCSLLNNCRNSFWLAMHQAGFIYTLAIRKRSSQYTFQRGMSGYLIKCYLDHIRRILDCHYPHLFWYSVVYNHHRDTFWKAAF